MTEKVGGGRLRVAHLPNGQFMLILDRAGWISDQLSREDAFAGVRQVLERLGPECAGVWRFADELDIGGLDVPADPEHADRGSGSA